MKNINNYLGLLTLPLLFSVLFLYIGEKSIVFGNILVFSIIIFYLILGIFYFLFPKIIKFPSYIDKEIIRNISKFVVLFVLSGIISASVLIYFYQVYSGGLNLELRVTGKIAFTYLGLALVISPIIKILKIKRFAGNLIMLRQIFGIYSFIFLLKHLLLYVGVEFEFYKLYFDKSGFLWYYIKNMSVRYDVILGTIAFVPMCLLGVSSNKLSVQFLGSKVWKSLHTLIYPTFILAMIHIAFAGKMGIYYASILCIVVILRLIAYFLNSKEKGNLNSNTITKFTNSKNDGEYMKYICKVCGYIYDEKEGDSDGGLSPGTRFEDIPNDWVCPVCGVSKSDFEPLEQEKTINSNRPTLQLVSKNYLTRDVLKVGFKSENYLEYNSGQYVIFELNDKDGKFDRNYSIAGNDGYIYYFIIKLNKSGRGSEFFRTVSEGYKVNIKGIFGKFELNYDYPTKVFIATGTGIAPIVSMVEQLGDVSDCCLLFGVRSFDDLFYEDWIKSKNFKDVKIYLSKEKRDGYEYGRLELSVLRKYSKNTEFYICGNPSMVEEKVKELEEMGFTNIYFEKFI